MTHRPHHAHSLRGFTLLELSIVLVVIGLIVGGILVGKTLIDAATTVKIVRQMTAYQAAYNTFKAKYDCLPGDCTSATAWFGTTDANGNAVNNGNGDGQITGGETEGAWQHLGDGGLIAGAYTGSVGSNAVNYVVLGSGGNFPVVPGNSVQQGFEILYNSSSSSYYAGLEGNLLIIGVDLNIQYWDLTLSCVGNSSAGPTLQQDYDIDTKLDDGLATSGHVRISWQPGSRVNANGSYNVLSFGNEQLCSIGLLLD
jgi:prepilin-type N-terminal cleavage/methylation domain-containing protein